MKAVQYDSYGGPETVHVNDNAAKPGPGDGQVLVENGASSINIFDIKVRMGMMKEKMPLQFPVTIGGDFSGTVTGVGNGVKGLKVGDEIFGTAIVLSGGSGGMAEFLTANEANSALKPKTADVIQASALPLVGASAVMAIEEHIKLRPGQKILIHGGAGGIGHLAIQLAKSIGAYVATTVKKEDEDFVRGLGADQIIDFRTEKFEDSVRDFDAVFDTVGKDVTDRSFAVLKKGGIIVSMVGAPNPETARKAGVTAVGQQSKTDSAHLKRVAELVDGGKLHVNVDKVFPIDEARDAFVYQEGVHPRGKVVIRMR